MRGLVGIGLDLVVGNWRMASLGAAVMAVLGYHFYAKNQAWHEGYATHKAEVSEKTKDLNANLDRLTEKHRAATEAYLRERAEANELREKLDEQARDSDNADRPALDAGSVLRLPRQP